MGSMKFRKKRNDWKWSIWFWLMVFAVVLPYPFNILFALVVVYRLSKIFASIEKND